MGSWCSPCSDSNTLRSLFVHNEEGHRQLSASSMINPLQPDRRGEDKQKIRRRDTTPTTVHSFKYSLVVGGSAPLASDRAFVEDWIEI